MDFKRIDARNYDIVSNNHYYMVHLDPDSCTCMDWTLKGPKDCIHIKYIKEQLEGSEHANPAVNRKGESQRSGNSETRLENPINSTPGNHERNNRVCVRYAKSHLWGMAESLWRRTICGRINTNNNKT